MTLDAHVRCKSLSSPVFKSWGYVQQPSGKTQDLLMTQCMWCARCVGGTLTGTHLLDAAPPPPYPSVLVTYTIIN